MHVQTKKGSQMKFCDIGSQENTSFSLVERNTAMPRTSENDRLRAVGMLQAGSSVSATARRFNVQRSTLRVWWARFQGTGSVSDLPGRGRGRVTTARQDRFILLTHLRNRFQPATVTAREIPGARRISDSTVRRRLRENDLQCRRPAVRPPLQPRHRRARLQWAREHLRWRLAQWGNVLFTDESRFLLSTADGRQRVYRRAGERYADNCVVNRLPYGGGGVMVWGGISLRRRTNLVFIEGNLNGARYRDEIIQQHVVPFVHDHGPGIVLQHDNAPAHRALIVQDHLQEAQIDVLPWPAVSPDLAPIEHVWDELQRRIHHRRAPPVTLPELRRVLREEWQAIPQAFLARLVISMRRRCQACVDAQGGHTRY